MAWASLLGLPMDGNVDDGPPWRAFLQAACPEAAWGAFMRLSAREACCGSMGTCGAHRGARQA